MRMAITGGTGFVGGALATRLRRHGHVVVLLSRRTGYDLAAADPNALVHALRGCETIVHCAGINREIGQQTYTAVHVRGTATLIEAARKAGVNRIVLLSFLRARPDGPTKYHRSKWAAEDLVRSSGLDHTIVKAGVIYGHGDHMLDHLSRAFHTFPVFGLVGLVDRPVRPVAVDDAARLLEAAATGDVRLRNRTIAALGPEDLPLEFAVGPVADVVGRRPRFIRLPLVAHLALAHLAEVVMRVPLLSVAQAHILAEGVVEPAPFAEFPPSDLAPRTMFSPAAIRAGLPPPGGFGRRDLRWCPTWRRSSPAPGGRGG